MAENGLIYDLSAEQRRAIDALATGANKQTVAELSGRSIRTVDRWLNDPVFQSALNAQTGQAIDAAGRKLVSSMETAVDSMIAIATDGTVTPSVRLKASRAILEFSVKLYELRELLARLDRLEAAVEIGQYHTIDHHGDI